ncbi:MAG: TIGR01459 family HAD-type hydrolase [Salinarimonadaceae bacterium]|nr:MAG: TIGR01459 family HAD-type hydrolase [Salinarimonadaceae bacterium]
MSQSKRQPAPESTRIISGLSEIAGDYDAIFCDVWGVLHNGMRAHAAAADALTRFRAAGKPVVLITNAPRPGDSVIGQLDRLGVPRTAFDDIVSSGDLTRADVRERAGAGVFHLGPERDRPIFAGLDARFVDAESAEYVVCSGLWDDEEENVDGYAPLLALLLERGLPMICANPDIVVERGSTLVPCAGAIAQAYEAIGGEVVYNGKPHAPVYREALRRAAAFTPEPARERILAIGDAIRTDIAGAREFGVDALFVARGIHAHELGLDQHGLSLATAEPWFAAQTHRPHTALDQLVW